MASLVRELVCFWGTSRPKGEPCPMTEENIIAALLNGESPAKNANLFAAINNIEPPQLCKLNVTMMTHIFTALRELRREVKEVRDEGKAQIELVNQAVCQVKAAPSAYLARISTAALQAAVIAAVLALLKYWGVV